MSQPQHPHTIAVMVFVAWKAVGALVRIAVSERTCDGKGADSIFCTLWLVPVVALVHVSLGGLLFFAWPYGVLLSSPVLALVLEPYLARRGCAQPPPLLPHPRVLRFDCCCCCLDSQG